MSISPALQAQVDNFLATIGASSGFLYTVDGQDFIAASFDGSDNVISILAADVAFLDFDLLAFLQGGNDIIDASTVPDTHNIQVFADTGDTDISLGADNDRVHYNGSFDGNDTLDGGDGIDELIADGTFLAGSLVNITNIEIIRAGSSASFQLDDSVLDNAGGVLALIGGPGADMIDASAVTQHGHAVIFRNHDDDDTLIGSGRHDFFYLDGTDLPMIDGGPGFDTVVPTGVNVIDGLAIVSKLDNIEAFDLSGNGSHQLQLDRTSIANMTDGANRLYVMGDQLDAAFLADANDWTVFDTNHHTPLSDQHFFHLRNNDVDLFVDTRMLLTLPPDADPLIG